MTKIYLHYSNMADFWGQATELAQIDEWHMKHENRASPLPSPFFALPPGFEPGYNLFLIPLVIWGVEVLALKRIGQVLLLNKMSRVVMSIFISFAIAHAFHQ